MPRLAARLIITASALGVLLTGCSLQPQPEAPRVATTDAVPLVSLAEAKQTAQDDIAALMSLIPGTYIDGEAEISQVAEDIQPCEPGSEDEFRWGGAAAFTLTDLGRSAFSTVEMQKTLASDSEWDASGTGNEDLEQDDPIFLYKENGQTGAVFVQTDKNLGRVSVLSPCFSLPGGPVEGTEY